MRQRILGYDLAKGLAMFLVVLLHYSFYTRYYPGDAVGSFVTSLCVVCVPLFFAVNGALLLPRKLDVGRHYRKLAMIVGVLAVWKTLAALFFVFVDGTHEVGIKDFLKFQLGGPFGDYPTGYFWFMNALIAVYLVYPLVKLAFDEDGVALRACVAVLFAFTGCKDTAIVLLDMAGVATHHEFASLLGSLGEFDIFSGYGYVLLYFILGGIIGSHLDEIRSGTWPVRNFDAWKCWLSIVLCYACVFGIQRFQHAFQGVNLTVNYGYWLLPTMAATVLLLIVCLKAGSGHAAVDGVAGCVGRNTFGIYMLHMAALVLFSKLQTLPAMAWMGGLGSGVSAVVNVLCALVLFVCCLAAACVLRRIPGIRVLFSV